MDWDLINYPKLYLDQYSGLLKYAVKQFKTLVVDQKCIVSQVQIRAQTSRNIV